MYVKKDFIIILNKIRLPLKCLFLFMCFLYFTLKHIYSEKKKEKRGGVVRKAVSLQLSNKQLLTTRTTKIWAIIHSYCS